MSLTIYCFLLPWFCRDDASDSLAKMEAAEQVLETKEKVCLSQFFIVYIPYFLDGFSSLTSTFFFLVAYCLCYFVIDLVSAILISNI